MPKKTVLATIKQFRRPVFTTREIVAASGKTPSNVIQALNHLEREGVLIKAASGIWVLDIGRERISQYSLIPFLLPRGRAYVSFISALHLSGIIEQIPQTITLASTSHTRTIKTKFGTFFIHRIAPYFFKGFGWYKGSGNFLIAEPEKALVDCLYLSARRKKQFGHFPELHFPRQFRFKRAFNWTDQIRDPKIRAYVVKRLKLIKGKRGQATF